MDGLERHDVPDGVDPEGWTLDVTGSVDRPLRLGRDDLDRYPTTTHRGDFACVEGWTAEGLRWRGVRVGDLLADAEPTDESEFALVSAMDGEYACGFPLADLADAVLAVALDGDPLPTVHGGPARLVPATDESDCWQQVKWVAAIEVVEDRPSEGDTAREIALSRIEE